MTKKRIVQILTVIALVVIIAGIYIVKQVNVSRSVSEPVLSSAVSASAEVLETSSYSGSFTVADLTVEYMTDKDCIILTLPSSVRTSQAEDFFSTLTGEWDYTISEREVRILSGNPDEDLELLIALVEEYVNQVKVKPLFVSSLDMEELRNEGLPVMIQFYTTSCIPCQSMMDDLKSFYAESYGKVRVVALNVEEHPEAAMDYPVMVVPTQIFLTASGENYVPSSRIKASVGNFVQFVYSDTGKPAWTVHQGVLSETQMKRITEDAGGFDD